MVLQCIDREDRRQQEPARGGSLRDVQTTVRPGQLTSSSLHLRLRGRMTRTGHCGQVCAAEGTVCAVNTTIIPIANVELREQSPSIELEWFSRANRRLAARAHRLTPTMRTHVA